MDKSVIILLLGLSCSCCIAQDLEIKIVGPATREVKEGQSLQLVCHVNKGLDVVITNKVQWVHVSKVDNTEKVLSTSQNLETDMDAENLSLILDYRTSDTNFTLSIASLKPWMDGQFVCRDVSEPNGGQEDVVTLIVLSNVKEVQLTFDGEMVKTEDAVAVQREEGEFKVDCTVKGFSPSADVKLLIGDQQVETPPATIELDDKLSQNVKARRYKASMSVDNLKLGKEHNGKTLKCVARASFSGSTSKVASLPLEVIVWEPEIHCEENEKANTGDRYIELNCQVKHENVKIDRFSWIVDGEAKSPGSSDDQFSVIANEVEGAHATDVTLHLYHVKEEDIDKKYTFTVKLQNGVTYSKEVTLHDKNTNSSAPLLAGYFLVFLLCLLVRL